MGSSGLGQKRIAKAKTTVSLRGMHRNCRSLWLDSGAHSLYHLHVLNKKKDRFVWYASETGKLTPEFRAYMDKYAAFVKEHKDGIDYYANVDVIYNAELSWKALKYLEQEHGLNPVPVIHHRTPLKWVEKHLEAGYTYIGLGGLGQESTKHNYREWADETFDFLCNRPYRLPCVRTHGFAMTSYSLMLRYPWWSTDSTSAFKVAGFGGVFLPHKRKGKFTFDVAPHIVAFSHRSSAKGDSWKHYANMGKLAQEVLCEWLDEIDVPLGIMGDNEQVVNYGVASEYNARAAANLRFFQKFCEWLPEWPRPFILDRKSHPADNFFPRENIK